MKQIQLFILHLLSRKQVIIELAKRDIQQKYMGSYLGFIWIFLQPLLFILILYAVFSLGFRSGLSDGIPFSIYLVSGIVSWLFFAENLSSAADAVRDYSFLVKRIDFRLSILPIVKLLSSLVPHVVFVLLAIILAWSNGYAPSIYTLQVFYYLASVSILLLGLGWLTSSSSLFVPDVKNLVNVTIQFGFWLTPILWNTSLIPKNYQWLISLNPMYYVVNGYRDSLITRVAFWERPYETIVFWIMTGFIVTVGITVFRKLRPHFAEVI